MRVTLLALALLAALARAQDVLVVAPEEFRPALAEWRAHRQAQGLVVTLRAPAGDVRALVQVVHEQSEGRLRYVLLLGDVKDIPCDYEQGKILAPYERDPRIANDNRCADLDADGLPDLAVGRLPADTPAEAELLLKKVLDYERNKDASTWRRRVNVVAGVGGFGPLADWALEQVATKLLTTSVPAHFDVHVTYANPRSPFCPYPPAVADTVLRRFNEGALVVTYLGHGSRLRLDRLMFGGKSYDIFDEDQAYALEAEHGPPIAFLVACSTGHMDGAPDCLAELAVKRPRGPVAVIASSRVSMPYANGVFAKEMLEALLLRRGETLGDVFREAKRRMLEANADDEGRRFIETLALGYELDARKRERERLEHVYLYNLFGDPTMRLPRMAAATLQCEAQARPGTTLAVKGTSPVNGAALIELVAERTPLVPRRRGDAREDFERAYAGANSWTRASARAPAAEGRFEAELALPEGLRPGRYHVRVYVQGEGQAALGSRPVTVPAPGAEK